MTTKDYYTAPPDHIFEEIKSKAIDVWETYDNTYGYSSGKINRIKELKNAHDNAWYIVAMMDLSNQAKLLSTLSEDARAMVIDAMSCR